MVEGKTVELFRCPAREIAPAVERLLFFYPFIESGSWPAEGPVLRQAATFVQGARLVQGVIGRQIENRMKEDEPAPGRPPMPVPVT